MKTLAALADNAVKVSDGDYENIPDITRQILDNELFSFQEELRQFCNAITTMLELAVLDVPKSTEFMMGVHEQVGKLTADIRAWAAESEQRLRAMNFALREALEAAYSPTPADIAMIAQRALPKQCA